MSKVGLELKIDTSTQKRGYMNRESRLKVILEAQNRTSLESTERFEPDLGEIVSFVEQARELGCRIVLTQGTFDLIHVGHARYVREAQRHGDILIVGIDDDEKARGRKGENRPFIPFEERWEMMTHLRYADLVTVKKADHPKWHLIKTIRPDVLVGVEGTYTEEEIEQLNEFCGEVIILPRQAKTSTSEKVRKVTLSGAEDLTHILIERIPAVVQEAYQELRENRR